MKKIIIAIIGILISFSAFSTAQEPDYIYYKGKKYTLFSNPMEEFFNKHPDKRPSAEVISTSLWRGYIAYFEVINNQMFLKNIEIETKVTDPNSLRTSYGWKSVLSSIVPDTTKMLKVEWFTGLLIMPYGKLKNYVHMGYGSEYAKYVILEVKNGEVTKERKLNFKEYMKFKDRQFEAFRQTDEYKDLKNSLLQQNGSSDSTVDSFIRYYITNYTSKILTN